MALTGHIQAEDEPAFAFRIGGRVIERPVNAGARVTNQDLGSDLEIKKRAFLTAAAATPAGLLSASGSAVI